MLLLEREMGKLSNDILREKSMRGFLTAMGIDISTVEVSSVEGLYGFSFTNPQQIDTFASKLNAVVQPEGSNTPVQVLKLTEIIEKELENSTCQDKDQLETHREASKDMLGLILRKATDFKFSQESGLLEVKLPGTSYANFLNTLKYPHLSFTGDGKLILNLKAYLKDYPAEVVKIEGLNANQLPLVFLNSLALERKQVFFATKTLGGNKVEITPYYFVPQASKPPAYHFLLDMSGSMSSDGKLDNLKLHVRSLARELFEFQPDARIILTTFSSDIKEHGEYTKADLPRFYLQVDSLNTRSDTFLYKASLDKIEKIKSNNNFNNVLLFTDGQDNGGNENQLSDTLTSLHNTNPLFTARTKFNIFSYGTNQSLTMHKVADTFASKVIETSQIDFMEASNDPELMKKWAASRDLFTSRMVVENRKGDKQESTYVQNLDMSGQLACLQPKTLELGETLTVTIKDGNNNVVVESSKSIELPKPSHAGLLATIGINAVPNTSKSVDQTTNVPALI